MLRFTKILLIIMTLAIVFIAGCATSSLKVGDAAPDFELKSLNGLTITLDSLKNRPVLLNFWTTWCPYCINEMPFFQQISDDSKWQSRGLVVLAVNIKESEAIAREFMTGNGLSFTVLLDTTGELATIYNVSAIPVTYIVDKDGIIKSIKTGPFSGKAHIDQVLTDVLVKD